MLPSALIGKPFPDIRSAGARQRARTDKRASRKRTSAAPCSSTSGPRGVRPVAPNTKNCCAFTRRAGLPIIGVNYKDNPRRRACGSRSWAIRTSSTSSMRDGTLRRRPRRVRRAREFSRRCVRHDRLQTRRRREPPRLGATKSNRTSMRSRSPRQPPERRMGDPRDRDAVALLRLRVLVVPSHAAPPKARSKRLRSTIATQEARYRALTEEFRCPKCLNTNLAGSDAPIAADLRATVHRLILEGATDQAIRDYLQARYGDFVLYDPPVRRDTLLLWIAPVAVARRSALRWWWCWRGVAAASTQPLNDSRTGAPRRTVARRSRKGRDNDRDRVRTGRGCVSGRCGGACRVAAVAPRSVDRRRRPSRHQRRSVPAARRRNRARSRCGIAH